MYIPKINAWDDEEAMIAFMQAHNFATVVSVQDGVPVATHLPLTITRDGESILLRGHFARANAQWQQLGGDNTLAMFTGPHAYVSPTHYDKTESVPTWNYLAVHAYGSAELLHFEDHRERLEHLLEELIQHHESAYLTQWRDLSERYREGMMRGIVGFEMPITRLEGKAKLSQNKHTHEQQNIIDALLQSRDTAAYLTGVHMQERLKGEE